MQKEGRKETDAHTGYAWTDNHMCSWDSILLGTAGKLHRVLLRAIHQGVEKVRLFIFQLLSIIITQHFQSALSMV